MKFTRIIGPAQHLMCAGCTQDGVGGSEPYLSASTQEERQPEEWYVADTADGPLEYCSTCAAKMVETDPTRAVHQYFSDTAGNEVKPENLPDF